MLLVDFSRKAGKQRVVYHAVYDQQRRVIEWDDTNVWKQLFYNRAQLTGLCPLPHRGNTHSLTGFSGTKLS